MARGRSRQRSTPMALRASGRSSHTVATESSTSMLSTGDSKLAISPMAARLTPSPGAQRGPSRVDGLRLHVPHRGRGPTLHTFTAEASAALPGPDWLRRRRAAAFEAFAATPLPSEKRGGVALHAHRRPGPRRLHARSRRRPTRSGSRPPGRDRRRPRPRCAGSRPRAQRDARPRRRDRGPGDRFRAGAARWPRPTRSSVRCSRGATRWCVSTTPSLPDAVVVDVPAGTLVARPPARRALV